jgi:hypothetical protein
MADTVIVESGKLDEITTIGTIENVKIAEWPCPKVNNEGVSGSWDWRVAGSVAVALLSTAAAYTIAEQQYQTAKAYWKLARERWDYFLNTYRPCEEREVAEACTAIVPTANYDRAIMGYTSGVTLAYSRADDEILRLSKLYCVCTNASLVKDIELMRSQMVGDGVNYAIRREESVAEALDDVRWNRKIGVLNRGRGLLSQSTSYARAASDMYDQFGKSVSAVAQGATQFLGYAMNRNDTVYPARNQQQYPGYAGYSVPPAESVDGLTQFIQNSNVPVQDTGSPTGGDYVGVNNAVNVTGIQN